MDVIDSHLWTPAGWHTAAAEPHRRELDTRHLGRYVLPGVANIHSHAFQRAMAGLVERRGDPQDSFWTWRELMYSLAARIGPDSLRAVATMLYAEMLEAGFTTVCEFHYLHNDPHGLPYAEPAALSLALIEAADQAGIRLLLMPTLYQTGGFDGRALSPRQRRFGLDTEAYLALFERLRREVTPAMRLGVAFHSLRAVPEAAMHEVLSVLPSSLPVHIHISEQVGEVDECLQLRGARPVEWLLDHFYVDSRWCLVHATHLDASEVLGIAASGATVALCPTTEANLGDGLFPLPAFRAAGGRWGIGSDSHVSVSLAEELRWLEYGQRLQARRRNITASAAQPSCGESLFAEALAGGRAAAGLAVDEDDAGDAVVLDDRAVELAERPLDRLLDSFVFAGNRSLVRDVYVDGQRRVADGVHVLRPRFEQEYRRALRDLLAQP